MDGRQFVNYFKGERIAVHLGSQVPVPAQRQGGMFCLIWHPLQCSCLEDPRDGGAWWPAVHGVAKSRTQLSDFTFMHWRRAWHPTPVLLPGGSHGWRSLVGCSPWGREGSDMTEQLHFHFSLSCIGEGNGNPLQCSSLENPRDGGAWWAPVYGVTQSWIRLKQLSSSGAQEDIFLQDFLRKKRPTSESTVTK